MPKEYIAEKQTAMIRRVVSEQERLEREARDQFDFNIDWQDVKPITTLAEVLLWFHLWPKGWLSFAPGRTTLHIYKAYHWGDYTGRVFCGKSFLDTVPVAAPLCKQCLNFFHDAICTELSARKYRPVKEHKVFEERRLASYAP